MKFGILQFFSWPDRKVTLPTVYDRALQRIEIMDHAGYDDGLLDRSIASSSWRLWRSRPTVAIASVLPSR